VVCVHDAAEARHAVGSADFPAGGVGFDSLANQIFAGAFDLTAANALAFTEPPGVVDVMLMGGEIVQQSLDRPLR